MDRKVSAQDARQGKPLGVMRWVLGLGMAGAVVGLAVAAIVIGWI